MKKIFSTIVLLTILTAIGCKNDESGGVTSGFDRQLMLQELADHVIIPAYDTLQKSTTSLEAAIDIFISDPNTTTLAQSRQAFEKAYHAWQNASFYDFGPAMDVMGYVNTFPTSKIVIDNNISSGTYDLSTIDSKDEQGLPAIDYLLFGIADSDAAIVDMYTTDGNASNRKDYLHTLVHNLTDKVGIVVTGWTTYRQTFIDKDGTDAGSSISLMVNELNRYFETQTRDKKIGIPLGKRSINNTPIPANVEAFYSGISISLALENLKAIRDLYMGIGPEEDVTSLYEYLKTLKSQHNGGLLADAIKNQFETAIKEVGEIPSPYSETVETNPTPANEAYQELQKLVILLKVDMPSALGVLISYEDNDGD